MGYGAFCSQIRAADIKPIAAVQPWLPNNSVPRFMLQSPSPICTTVVLFGVWDNLGSWHFGLTLFTAYVSNKLLESKSGSFVSLWVKSVEPGLASSCVSLKFIKFKNQNYI